jgi:hypothetical protein
MELEDFVEGSTASGSPYSITASVACGFRSRPLDLSDQELPTNGDVTSCEQSCDEEEECAGFRVHTDAATRKCYFTSSVTSVAMYDPDYGCYAKQKNLTTQCVDDEIGAGWAVKAVQSQAG